MKNKVLKRILSVILAVAMVIGLIPFGALAQTTLITEVFLQLESYPAVGEELVYPTIYTVDGSEEVDDKLAITFSRWYAADYYTLDGNAYGGYYGEAFVADKAYNLNLELTPADGYAIAEDCNVVLMAPSEYFGSGYEYPRSYADGTVAYDFFFNLTAEEPTLSSAVFSLFGTPEAGVELASLMPELTEVDESDSYLRPLDYRASWRYYDAEDETYYYEEDTFKEEHEYFLFVEVFAREAYELNDAFELRLQLDDAVLNGELYGEREEKNATYRFSVSAQEELTWINEIVISAAADPQAGATPFMFEIVSVNGSAELIEASTVSTGWGKYDAEEDVYLPNGLIPFEAGAKYAASIFLLAEEGYAFADGCEVTVLTPSNREWTLEYGDSSELDGAVFYPAIESELEGDIDGNGVVGAADVTALLQEINGGNAVDSAIGDLNGDGKVSLADALRLLKQISA